MTSLEDNQCLRTLVPSGLTVQQWDEKYFREYLNSNWFKRYMGTGSSSMIQVKEDLTKKPGDSVTFTLVNKLTGTAKDSSETLEGNGRSCGPSFVLGPGARL